MHDAALPLRHPLVHSVGVVPALQSNLGWYAVLASPVIILRITFLVHITVLHCTYLSVLVRVLILAHALCVPGWFRLRYPCGVIFCNGPTVCVTVGYPSLEMRSFGCTIREIITGVFNAISIVTDPLMRIMQGLLPRPPTLTFPNPFEAIIRRMNFDVLASLLNGPIRSLPAMPPMPDLPAIPDELVNMLKAVPAPPSTPPTRQPVPGPPPTHHPSPAPTSNEACTGNCNNYRGNQHRTQSGKTCQRWTVQTPHSHGNTPQAKPNFGLGSHNYCRNPDGGQTICPSTFRGALFHTLEDQISAPL